MDMGRREARMRHMERVTWNLTLPYVKYIANGNLPVWLRKLKQGLYIILEGWDGEGDGKWFKRERIYVYLWLIHVEA